MRATTPFVPSCTARPWQPTRSSSARERAPRSLTTRGFRDVLETATELRYDLHDLFIEFPEPLVPRHRRIGITERVRFDGKVVAPLAEAEVRDASARARRPRISRPSPCAFCTPTPTRPTRKRPHGPSGQERPDLSVSLSSRVLPEIGEYGRVSTTVANAYVQPLMSRYLAELSRRLEGDEARAVLSS